MEPTRLALLSGARPKSCTHGPFVRLIPGLWRIKIEGQIDSILLLSLDTIPAMTVIVPPRKLEPDLVIYAETPCMVQVSFDKRGSEEYITVMAEQMEKKTPVIEGVWQAGKEVIHSGS